MAVKACCCGEHLRVLRLFCSRRRRADMIVSKSRDRQNIAASKGSTAGQIYLEEAGLIVHGKSGNMHWEQHQ
jgi:hypothetical protein